jgi:Protein of unknown function (DUF3352)
MPAALLVSAALAGCGSGSSGTNADPASVAPGSAPLYASVTVKPAGGPASDAVSVAKALTHLSDPYGSLTQALLSTPHSRLDFKRDIGPWVGARAGIFITSIDAAGLRAGAGSAQALLEGGLTGGLSALSAGAFAGGTQGAIILDTSSVDGARSFLTARAREQQAHAASYRGVSYQVSSSGLAEGIVDRFAVIGSESALKSVVDTSLTRAAVTSAPNYAKAPANAIATAYLRPAELIKAVHGAGSAGVPALSLLSTLFAGAQDASLSVTPAAHSISLQGEVHSSNGSASLFGAQGARALGELPESAWLAAGAADVGANAGLAVSLLHSLGALGASTVLASLGGTSIERLLEKLTAPGMKLQRDFAGWAGRAGLYASGTGLFNIEAALVVDSKDPAASRAAVGKLASQLRSSGAIVAPATIAGADAAVSVKLQGFPAVIYVADGNSKLIVGLGQTSIAGALSPSKTLSGSASYSAAASALGQGIEPSLIVEFPTLVGFLEGIGLAQSPSLANLMPTLKSLGTLTAGSASGPGVQRFKLVLGLAAG